MKVSKKFIGLICVISLLFVFVSCDEQDVDKVMDKVDETVSENVDKVVDDTDKSSSEDSEAPVEEDQDDSAAEDSDVSAEESQDDSATEDSEVPTEESQDETSSEDSEVPVEEDQGDSTTEDSDVQDEEGKDTPTEDISENTELEIMIINNNKDVNNLWLGDATSIDESKEMKPGETRVEKVSVKVSEENVDDSLIVNIATGGEIVSTENIDINGAYIENKPVLVIWDGTEFTTSY